MLGDEPIRLRLLEVPQALAAAEGTALELADAAFPLLESVDVVDDARCRLRRCQHRPAGRGPAAHGGDGARRPPLRQRRHLRAAGSRDQRPAADDIRVLVVGNPANTNALIASAHAPDVPAERFTAMTRLDHNRALAQAGGEARGRGRAPASDDDLGQSLDRRRFRMSRNFSWTVRPPNSTRPGSTRSSSPRWRIAGPRSSPPAEHRRAASAASAAVDHVRDWVARHAGRATGRRSRFPAAASTASRRAW